MSLKFNVFKNWTVCMRELSARPVRMFNSLCFHFYFMSCELTIFEEYGQITRGNVFYYNVLSRIVIIYEWWVYHFIPETWRIVNIEDKIRQGRVIFLIICGLILLFSNKCSESALIQCFQCTCLWNSCHRNFPFSQDYNFPISQDYKKVMFDIVTKN